MDVDLDAQHGTARQSEIIRLFRALDGTYRDYSGGSWGFWGSPFTAWQQRNLAARLNVFLRERIVHCFSEQKKELQSPTATFVEDLEKKKKRSRSVLALSLQDIDTLTPAFIDSTCDQLKSFLSAGHDTTSILLQWTFYELSRTPRVPAVLVSELDDIFGPDPSPYTVREKLLSNSEGTLRKMSYTSAVIKEILRLYPPTASARKAAPGAGYFVNFPDGRELCMDGLIVYNCEAII
jgi:cytochrome P450